jgi:hypothetical protein
MSFDVYAFKIRKNTFSQPPSALLLSAPAPMYAG